MKRKKSPPRGECAAALLTQILLCAVLLAGALLLRSAYPAEVAAFQHQADLLLTAPLGETLPAGGLSGLLQPTPSAPPEGVVVSQVRLSQRALWPTAGEITSGFGWRAHPVYAGYDFHRGIDIAAPLGSPIRAAYGGVVTAVAEDELYGKTVLLTHSGGLSTFYAHCSAVYVEQGLRLRAGELLAAVGSTGLSTGPHLHFEVRLAGKPFHPLLALEPDAL